VLSTFAHITEKPRWNLWPAFLVRAAKRHGFNHIFLGEGADELFGGYEKKSYLEAWADSIVYIMSTHKQICKHFDVTLHCPFLKLDIVDCMPYHENPLKHHLRAAYANLLPEWIVNMPSMPPNATKYKMLIMNDPALMEHTMAAETALSEKEAMEIVRKLAIQAWSNSHPL
jgi:asparagine synthetase B (glutamine-hydrolysing)